MPYTLYVHVTFYTIKPLMKLTTVPDAYKTAAHNYYIFNEDHNLSCDWIFAN